MKRAGLAIAALLVGALVVAGIWYAWGQKEQAGESSGTSVNSSATPVPRPAPPVGEYAARAEAAVAPLRTALAEDDAAALAQVVAPAKTALMELVVPADRRAAHLALILALGTFAQVQAQGGSTAAAQASIAEALTAFPASP